MPRHIQIAVIANHWTALEFKLCSPNKRKPIITKTEQPQTTATRIDNLLVAGSLPRRIMRAMAPPKMMESGVEICEVPICSLWAV